MDLWTLREKSIKLKHTLILVDEVMFPQALISCGMITLAVPISAAAIQAFVVAVASTFASFVIIITV